MVADDVVEVVALDALKVRRLGPFTLAQLQPLLERHDARACVAQVDLAGEAVELLHPLDRVALDRRPHGLSDGPQKVYENGSTKQVVDLLLPRGVPTHEPLQCRRFVGRVVVDVQRRVGRQPLEEEVHQPLERPPLSGERELAVVLARPEGMERAVRLEYAKEVVEAIVEGIRIALDVEKQVV